MNLKCNLIILKLYYLIEGEGERAENPHASDPNSSFQKTFVFPKLFGLFGMIVRTNWWNLKCCKSIKSESISNTDDGAFFIRFGCYSKDCHRVLSLIDSPFPRKATMSFYQFIKPLSHWHLLFSFHIRRSYVLRTINTTDYAQWNALKVFFPFSSLRSQVSFIFKFFFFHSVDECKQFYWFGQSIRMHKSDSKS